MKKIIILLFATVLSFSAYAQRDIKTLDGKTAQQIINIIGTPDSKDFGESLPEYDCLEYKDTYIAIVHLGIDGKTTIIDSFKTSSKKYCVLSHLVSGGIKVGDSLSKLQSIDFASTPYGRKKQANALKAFTECEYTIYGYDVNYVIYEQEYSSIYFAVQNGVIKAWSYECKPDSPYEPYDSSIKIW